MPQATITTAIYDMKKRVLIPKETPSFTDFQEVMVVFFPKEGKKNGESSWNNIIRLLKKSRNYNKNVSQDELDDVVEEVIASVRNRPKEHFVLD